ncbi:MAG: iron-containing redox enzyme family protein [Candidatus Binatia bacterium]
MDRNAFCQQLLSVMEHKDHWAWPAFTSGMVPRGRLHIHFEQEYATYVRDFPVMVGWAYVQCSIPAVRRALAENLYEEETGALAAGRPHPELFLEYPKGLGMNLRRFGEVKLLPAAKAYRAFLDDAIKKRGWEIAAAIVTVFIEGTKDDRVAVERGARKQKPPVLSAHPLVKHYGLPLKHLALTKAHQQVEGGHRAAAWKAILDHVPREKRKSVLTAVKRALTHWLRYRDAVAAACGIERGPHGRPRLAV